MKLRTSFVSNSSSSSFIIYDLNKENWFVRLRKKIYWKMCSIRVKTLNFFKLNKHPTEFQTEDFTDDENYDPPWNHYSLGDLLSTENED